MLTRGQVLKYNKSTRVWESTGEPARFTEVLRSDRSPLGQRVSTVRKWIDEGMSSLTGWDFCVTLIRNGSGCTAQVFSQVMCDMRKPRTHAYIVSGLRKHGSMKFVSTLRVVNANALPPVYMYREMVIAKCNWRFA